MLLACHVGGEVLDGDEICQGTTPFQCLVDCLGEGGLGWLLHLHFFLRLSFELSVAVFRLFLRFDVCQYLREPMPHPGQSVSRVSEWEFRPRVVLVWGSTADL